jgi:hypothetical protein
MNDFTNRFLHDLNNPETRNADNEGLGAIHAGPFTVGWVDEVNGPGVEELAFMPTRHELFQLVKYWVGVALDIEYFWFLYQQTGSSECRRHAFAWRRINRAAQILGEADVSKAIEEVCDELVKEEGSAWHVFLRGTEAEKAALQQEIDQQVSSVGKEEN